jgi:hypothetical protein
MKGGELRTTKIKQQIMKIPKPFLWRRKLK